jgi:hypothetical protein
LDIINDGGIGIQVLSRMAVCILLEFHFAF